ncbi:MAG: phosphotransferase [Gammaproteobacteria bacterium]|nr:phosphotransferase [Gammaproteobacteria bacterium]
MTPAIATVEARLRSLLAGEGRGPATLAVGPCLARTPVSQTWRVAVDGRPAVFRLDEPAAAALGLDRPGELAALAAAAPAGLSPTVLAADPARGLLLTAWLPGTACTPATLQPPAVLQAAGRLLRRVHDLPWQGPALDLPGTLARYGALAGRDTQALAAGARSLAARFPPPAGPALTLCHNDPSPANLILGAPVAAPGPAGGGGRLTLIDWEYAAGHVPWFDLAVLAVEARLPGGGATGAGPEPEAALLAAYLGRSPQPGESAALAAWMDFYGTLAEIWRQALARIAAETLPSTRC